MCARFFVFWCVICCANFFFLFFDVSFVALISFSSFLMCHLFVSWWAGLIGLAMNWIWFCMFLWFSSWCCQPVCIKSLCTLHQWLWCAFRSTGQTIWLLVWTLVTLPRMWQKPRTTCRCIMNARWDQATQMECYCATGTWTDSVQSPQVSVLSLFPPCHFSFMDLTSFSVFWK